MKFVRQLPHVLGVFLHLFLFKDEQDLETVQFIGLIMVVVALIICTTFEGFFELNAVVSKSLIWVDVILLGVTTTDDVMLELDPYESAAITTQYIRYPVDSNPGPKRAVAYVIVPLDLMIF